MKKDILFHPVKGVQVAIVKNTEDPAETAWEVVVINRNDKPITNVFVTSKGYGTNESGVDVGQKTSTLRHFFPEIAPGAHTVVEPIMPELFSLNNEFWISYFIENQIYDKKFIFVPDSIVDANLLAIEPMGLVGVLHE